SLPISGVSILLSPRTMIQPDRIGDLRLTVGFRWGAEDYVGRLDGTGLHIARGAADSGTILFAGAPNAFAGFIYGKLDVEQLGGGLTVTGDMALARRFAALFHLPPKFYPKAASSA
ncbi:MAG: transcriptional regulator, partial [Sphingobium sp.]